MVYYGDINNRRHLVLFKFSNEARTLTIYQYSNYYTKELTTLIRQIQNITAKKKRGVQSLFNVFKCFGTRGNAIPNTKIVFNARLH
jgi:hypothetical protein